MVVDPARRYQTMAELFSPEEGIGLSMLRQPMGATDFAVHGVHSYDDMPAGQSDPTCRSSASLMIRPVRRGPWLQLVVKAEGSHRWAAACVNARRKLGS